MFVHERQEILWRRIKNPEAREPFTSNTILRELSFTNINREVDSGTRFLRQQMFQQHHDLTVEVLPQILFQVITYRHINKRGTFEEFGSIPSSFDEWIMMRKFIAEKKEEDESFKAFTGAHQVQGEDKVSELLTRVQEEKTSLAEELLAATTLEDCIKLLSSLPHTGSFMSWQILMDLVELGFIKNKEDEQTFVQLGPGALKGIDKIFGVSSDAMEKSLMLSKIMMPAFRLLKLNYKSFLGEEKISIKAIEHALCEYHKYCEAVKSKKIYLLFCLSIH